MEVDTEVLAVRTGIASGDNGIPGGYSGRVCGTVLRNYGIVRTILKKVWVGRWAVWEDRYGRCVGKCDVWRT